MKNRNKLKISILILITFFVFSFNFVSEEGETWPSSDHAKEFVKSNIVMDFISSPYEIGWNDQEELYDYFDRAIAAGITGMSATLVTKNDSWEDLIKAFRIWEKAMLASNDFIFVHRVDDIMKAHQTGKYAVIWNSQTSTIINGDLEKIKELKELGIGSMQLVYNESHKAGYGVLSFYRGKDQGLNFWGEGIIDEMVKQGIVIDLSHAGKNTCDDVIAYMQKRHRGIPVIYSHSLPHGLYKNGPNATEKGCYRNISDEQAIAAASTGGVVSPAFTEWMMDGVWQENITPQQCADMIGYYVKLIGVDHVGIASNDMFKEENAMSFVEDNPDAFNDDDYKVTAFMKGAVGSGELAKILPAITDELWKRGYSNEDIKKIYGLNMLRVYKNVWK